MAYKEQTLLRSWVEIHIPCPNTDEVLRNENSVVMRTAKKFTFWFGETDIRQEYKPRFNESDNINIEIVYIVLSYCTTETLKRHIVTAISYAKEIVKEIGRDRIVMVVNGIQFYVRPV